MAITPPSGEFANKMRENLGVYADDVIPLKDEILTGNGSNLKIYRDVHRDPQVKATFQQRRSAVVSSEVEVEPFSDSAQDKLVADFIRDQVKALQFDDITDKMLFSVFYGWGVAENIYARDGRFVVLDQVKVKDQGRYRFDRDRNLYMRSSTNYKGERVPDRKFWTITTGAENDENPYGLGLAHYLYWPVYFKKNGLKFWLIFLEKFGMPTAAAKMPSGAIDNPTLKRQALEALQAIQSDSGVLIPQGIEIELMEAARGGTADYSTMQKAMDSAIAKIVLSQTMTTDDGSSRSQSETHKDVRDEVVKADADLICQSFNRQTVRWLVDFNFGPDVPAPRVWRKTEPEEDELQRVERDSKIYAMGYEPTDDYIRDTYGDGWQRKQTPDPLGGFGPGFEGDEPTGGPMFTEAGQLIQQRRNLRADQQAIAIASQQFANKYEDIIGKRIQKLLDYAETTGDFEAFRKGLAEMAEEGPDQETVDKVQRGGFFARLAGALKGQR